MLGLQNGKSLKHAKKQQNLDFFRIFAEFSRKFALKVHEEPYEVGVRFFFCTIAKVFRRFQVARDSFSLLKPRKLRPRLSKFRIFFKKKRVFANAKMAKNACVARVACLACVACVACVACFMVSVVCSCFSFFI